MSSRKLTRAATVPRYDYQRAAPSHLIGGTVPRVSNVEDLPNSRAGAEGDRDREVALAAIRTSQWELAFEALIDGATVR